MTLGIIRRTRSKDFVVFSDSLSSLQAIDSRKTENALVLKILKEYTHLSNGGKSVTFCWIPSHVGIRGNENADTAAKAGLDEPITDMKFPVSDLLTFVNQLCTREWQNLWSQCTSNKLYSVQPVIGHHTKISSLSHHDRVVINHLRVGHTRLTNSYLLKGENQPECQACQSALTVKHILIDCTHLSAVHQRYFRVDTLK